MSTVNYTYDASLDGVDLTTFKAEYERFGSVITGIIKNGIASKKAYNNNLIKVIDNGDDTLFQTTYDITKDEGASIFSFKATTVHGGAVVMESVASCESLDDIIAAAKQAATGADAISTKA